MFTLRFADKNTLFVSLRSNKVYFLPQKNFAKTIYKIYPSIILTACPRKGPIPAVIGRGAEITTCPDYTLDRLAVYRRAEL